MIGGSQIVKRLKQKSVYGLLKTMIAFSRTLWKEKTFWSYGYITCSMGEGASYGTIQEYIKSKISKW